jgi:diaminopimelate epimerase
MVIEFSKMTGAGNDFVVLGPEYASLKSRAPELARRLCERRLSIGADGLILVDTPGPLFMHYYNRDGSRASFCGNGARCFVLFCKIRGIAGGAVEFDTDSGRHRGEVLDGGVRVSMEPARLAEELSLTAAGTTYDGHLVRAGVPHAVILLESLDEVDVEGVGRLLRSDPVFGDAGANVNFVSGEAANGFSIRTYERGVERETLACGSGCVAAAYVLREEGRAGDRVALRVASGATLTIEQPRGEGAATNLVGPADLVFNGRLDIKL